MRERTNLSICVAILVLFVVLGTSGTAAGKIIYVDDDAAGANDGLSWADAYKYLQDALADANSAEKPVKIHVAQGIYKPDQGGGNITGDVKATFQLINEATIKGGFAGIGEVDPNARDIKAYVTILSGDLNNDDKPNWLNKSDNTFHVVTGSGIDETAVLDGFTITAGYADFYGDYDNGAGIYIKVGSPILINCIFTGNFAYTDGGGMYNYNGSPSLTNCKFNKNFSGYHGGGMYNLESSPILKNCTFNENVVGRNFGAGAGISNETSSAILINCTFTGNWALSFGGGIYNKQCRPILTNCTFSGNVVWSSDGGGIQNTNSSPIITNCKFNRNYASVLGGGMCNYQSSPIVTKCTFSENSANSGGGISNETSSPILTNCMLIGNSAATNGGGMENFRNSSPILTKCTFTGNTAKTKWGCGGMFNSNNCNPSLTNCVLWNDTPDEIDGYATITYSNIKGGWPGIGNIDAEPCFVNPGHWADVNDPNVAVESNDPNAVWIDGDYHLKSQAGRWDQNSESWVKDDVTSPCIDAGDMSSPIGLEPFPNGGIVNMGAYGGTPEASKSYFGGPVCETIVAGDINGDCKVDFKDFSLMAYHWLEDNSPGQAR